VPYIITALYQFIQSGIEFRCERYNLITKTGEHPLELKVADTIPKRMHGLMWIESMRGDEGMLFTYPEPSVDSFWMKNTYIPLDFLFLDDDMKVTSVYENAVPHDEHTHIKPARPMMYAIEINAGLVKKLGIKAGDYLVKE
jgi:uncharacterized membrane protein (UPF0127 family)